MSGRRVIRSLLLLFAGAGWSSPRLCWAFFSVITWMELKWCCVCFLGIPPRGAGFSVVLAGIRPQKRQRGGSGGGGAAVHRLLPLLLWLL